MVELFFRDINIETKSVNFYRLGKQAPGKIRPPWRWQIAQKDMVMNNQNLLKWTENELGKLSVREHLTKNAQEQVKKYVDSAKEEHSGSLGIDGYLGGGGGGGGWGHQKTAGASWTSPGSNAVFIE